MSVPNILFGFSLILNGESLFLKKSDGNFRQTYEIDLDKSVGNRLAPKSCENAIIVGCFAVTTSVWASHPAKAHQLNTSSSPDKSFLSLSPGPSHRGCCTTTTQWQCACVRASVLAILRLLSTSSLTVRPFFLHQLTQRNNNQTYDRNVKLQTPAVPRHSAPLLADPSARNRLNFS